MNTNVSDSAGGGSIEENMVDRGKSTFQSSDK